MKVFIICLSISIMSVSGIVAQDSLFLKNGGIEVVKVLGVEKMSVSYKRFSNPDGPTYSKISNELLRIKYKNGEVEVIPIYKTLTDLSQKGTRVFLEAESADIKDLKQAVEKEFNSWGYWTLVANTKESDFILQIQTIKKGMGAFSWGPRIKVQAIIKSLDGQILWTSESYTGNSNGFTGFSSLSDALSKLIKKGIEPKFNIVRK